MTNMNTLSHILNVSLKCKARVNQSGVKIFTEFATRVGDDQNLLSDMCPVTLFRVFIVGKEGGDNINFPSEHTKRYIPQ